MSHDTHVEARTQAQFEYDRHHNADHMRKQVVQLCDYDFLNICRICSSSCRFCSKHLLYQLFYY